MPLAPSAARPWCLATTLGALALAPAGCDQPTGSSRPRSGAPAAVGVSAPGVEAPAPAKPRELLSRPRTQDIRDARVEAKVGGVETTPRITAKDPITLAGNAYVTIVGQSSILSIEHALRLYEAETGAYPKTFDEFREQIIQKNNIALAPLPSYQEYGYDVPGHRLIIIEYPDRKENASRPQ